MLSESRHTRFVALARIGLPLAALALLSTLFLISDRVDPEQASLYADVDVSALVKEQRVGAPQYAGVTEAGDSLMAQASAAVPDANGGQGATAQDLSVRIDATDGATADLSAKTGRLDPAGGQLRLTGGVAIKTSTGYQMTTEAADIATDSSAVTAPGPVQGVGPFGKIDAGSMTLSRPAPDAPYDLVFNGGVNLVYQPEK